MSVMLVIDVLLCRCLFFKQKTAYEMRISDWSSDVCSSDLNTLWRGFLDAARIAGVAIVALVVVFLARERDFAGVHDDDMVAVVEMRREGDRKSTRLNSSH